MAAKLIIDTNYSHTSKKETVTVAQALAWFANRLDEDSILVDEEGEPNLPALAAKAICQGYLRAKALDKDGARVAAKLAPSKIYTARLGDTSKEAAQALEAARQEAYKVSGIVPPAVKAKPAPAPAKDLEAQIAKLMAENAALKAPAPKAKPVKAPKPEIIVQTPAVAALVQAAQALAAPAKPAKGPRRAKDAPAVQAEAPAPTLAAIVEWFKADTSRDTKAARVAFPMISAVKLANCYRAAKV